MPLQLTPIGDTGFSYTRASVDILAIPKPITPTPITPENNVIIVGETQYFHDTNLLDELERRPHTARFRLGSPGFQPIDTANLFPNEKVRLLKYFSSHFDFDVWARKMLDVPNDLDISFQHDQYARQNRYSIVARTSKKGKIVNVRKFIPDDELFVPAATRILTELQKTAPAPKVNLLDCDIPDYTCGAHLGELIKTLDETGLKIVKAWLAEDLAKREKHIITYTGSMIVVPGSFLIGANISQLTLSTTHKSNAVHASIEFPGRHSISDDESGASVVLDAQFSEIILSSLCKKSMSEVIDASWLTPLTVRTKPVSRDQKLYFRAFSENVPFVFGPPIPVGAAEVDRRLERAFINGIKYGQDETRPLWTEVDNALVPVFEQLTRRQLAIILVQLEMSQTVDLADFGLHGWTLRSRHPRIVAETQPGVSIEELGLIVSV